MADSKLQLMESVASYLPDRAVDWLGQYWVDLSKLGPLEQVAAIGAGIAVIAAVLGVIAYPFGKWLLKTKNTNTENALPTKTGLLIGAYSDLSADEQTNVLETLNRLKREPARSDESVEAKQEAIEEAFEGDAADLIALLKKRYTEQAFVQGVAAKSLDDINDAKAQTARDIGSLLALSDVSGSAAYYLEAVELLPDEFWWRIEYGRLLEKTAGIGPVWEQFGQAIRIARKNDDNREIAVANDALAGCHLRLGNIEKALPRLSDAVNNLRVLATVNSTNDVLQRDLLVAHIKMGDAQVLLGDFGGGRISYDSAISINRVLRKRDPVNRQWQRDLSVCYEKIGNIQVELRDFVGAHDFCVRALLISQDFCKLDPTNNEWQRDLSVAHHKLGDVQVCLDDFVGAQNSYTEALMINEILHNVDQKNQLWRRDLSASCAKLGEVQIQLGDLENAQTSYKRSMLINEQLSRSDPANSEWQRDLITSHVNLSEVGVEPAENLRRALAIAEAQKSKGKLAPVDDFMIEDLKKRIAALD